MATKALRWYPAVIYATDLDTLIVHPMGVGWPLVIGGVPAVELERLKQACEDAKADPAMAVAMTNICEDLMRRLPTPEKAVAR